MKTVRISNILFSAITSLVRLKYGNLDKEIYQVIESAEEILKTNNEKYIQVPHEILSNLTSLARIKYGNLDKDVDQIIRAVHNHLNKEKYFAVILSPSTLTRILDENDEIVQVFANFELAQAWADENYNELTVVPSV